LVLGDNMQLESGVAVKYKKIPPEVAVRRINFQTTMYTTCI